DDRIYDKLVRELGSWLQSYFRRRLTPAAADDAMQEVLLTIHTRRYAYKPGAFSPWLATIARYKHMDLLRRQHRDHAPLGDIEGSVPDHHSSICSRILLERLIQRLKPAQVNVIQLVKIHGASVEEASKATGQSSSLVKVNVHRGLRRLAAAIG